jgi:hypothetical protein
VRWAGVGIAVEGGLSARLTDDTAFGRHGAISIGIEVLTCGNWSASRPRWLRCAVAGADGTNCKGGEEECVGIVGGLT